VLTSIDYVAPPGATWPNYRFYMTPPDAFEPVHIRNVTGLDPVIATVNTRGFGVVDGEFYVGSSVPKRNIVITMGLNTIGGAATVSGARDLLYRYFLPKSLVKLQFNFDNRDPVQIDGYMESLTGDRFSQDPEMQLSVICPKPNFLSFTDYIFFGESSSSDTPNEEEILYLGDAGAGFVFEMEAGSSEVFSGDIEVRKRVGESTGFAAMNFNGVYIPQDWTLVIDTRQGHKRVEAVPPPEDDESEKINQFATMDDVTYWMQIFAGTNNFSVKATGISRDWRITYRNEFVGV